MFAAPLLFAFVAAGPVSDGVRVERGAVLEVEVEFEVDRAFEDPLRDVRPRVTFRHQESHREFTVDAFWAGGRTWQARFAPPRTGGWLWTAADQAAGSEPLLGMGGFTVTPSDRPGPPRLSKDRRHFTRARFIEDGGGAGEPEPWFLLSDTAWNGALRSTPEDWDRYLDVRTEQGFTAIQFVSTQWRGGDETLRAKPFTVRDGKVVGVDHEMLRAMDARVAAIAARGLAPAPALLWALGEDDPGRAWDEASAIRVARHLKARWGAHGCVWLLGGDGKYADADRWRTIGRAAFPEGESDGSGVGRGPVTLHMGGRGWFADPYADEPWFDFVGYQSGHGAADHDLRWLTRKEPATWWREHGLPVANLEPNYEAHPAYGSGEPHGAFHVRRAAYWSLLIAPPAGISYGHNAIWPWNAERGPIEGHARVGDSGPWSDGLRPGGAEDMAVLKAFFTSGPWDALRPAPDLIARQPDDPAAFVAAARTPDGAWTVIYAPTGGPVALSEPAGADGTAWTRFDPRTGERAPLPFDESGVLHTPAGHDWVIEGRAE